EPRAGDCAAPPSCSARGKPRCSLDVAHLCEVHAVVFAREPPPLRKIHIPEVNMPEAQRARVAGSQAIEGLTTALAHSAQRGKKPVERLPGRRLDDLRSIEAG